MISPASFDHHHFNRSKCSARMWKPVAILLKTSSLYFNECKPVGWYNSSKTFYPSPRKHRIIPNLQPLIFWLSCTYLTICCYAFSSAVGTRQCRKVDCWFTNGWSKITAFQPKSALPTIPIDTAVTLLAFGGHSFSNRLYNSAWRERGIRRVRIWFSQEQSTKFFGTSLKTHIACSIRTSAAPCFN